MRTKPFSIDLAILCKKRWEDIIKGRYLAISLLLLIYAVSVGASAGTPQDQHLLKGVPIYSQENDNWCQWVSAQMVLGYYGYSIPAQRIAIKTYEFANQKWDAKKGYNTDTKTDNLKIHFKNAITSLSENNLEIEEITTRDQKEMQSKIFEAIDNGYPVIIMSTGAWLYDLFGKKYPEGNGHASVIVGYSQATEYNNFKMFWNDMSIGALLALVHHNASYKSYKRTRI